MEEYIASSRREDAGKKEGQDAKKEAPSKAKTAKKHQVPTPPFYGKRSFTGIPVDDVESGCGGDDNEAGTLTRANVRRPVDRVIRIAQFRAPADQPGVGMQGEYCTASGHDVERILDKNRFIYAVSQRKRQIRFPVLDQAGAVEAGVVEQVAPDLR